MGYTLELWAKISSSPLSCCCQGILITTTGKVIKAKEDILSGCCLKDLKSIYIYLLRMGERQKKEGCQRPLTDFFIWWSTRLRGLHREMRALPYHAVLLPVFAHVALLPGTPPLSPLIPILCHADFSSIYSGHNFFFFRHLNARLYTVSSGCLWSHFAISWLFLTDFS